MAKIVGIGFYEAPGTVEAEYSPYDGVFGEEPTAPPILQTGMAEAVCKSAGGFWDPTSKQCVGQKGPPDPKVVAAAKAACLAAGLQWDPLKLTCVQSLPPPGTPSLAEHFCKQAGMIWNAATKQCMQPPWVTPGGPPVVAPPPPGEKRPIDIKGIAVLVGLAVVGAYLYKEYGGKGRRAASRNSSDIATRRAEFERRKAREAEAEARKLEESRVRMRRRRAGGYSRFGEGGGYLTLAEHAAELGLTPAEYRAIERSHGR